MILGIHGRFDDSGIHHIDFFEQIVLELCISLLKLDRAHHYRSGCLLDFMTLAALIGVAGGRVHVLEVICKALLNGQDVDPSIPPGF